LYNARQLLNKFKYYKSTVLCQADIHSPLFLPCSRANNRQLLKFPPYPATKKITIC